MEGGVGSLLFWGSLSFALVIAGLVAVPVNRWLIARGKGHAVVHQTGIHGGPSPRVAPRIPAARQRRVRWHRFVSMEPTSCPSGSCAKPRWSVR